MVIKFYDKLMDLLGREGSHQVGSRLHTVLGCSNQLSVFQRQISKVQKVGLTRVEVSICRDALHKHRPFDPSFKTVWHIAADRDIKALAGAVLNRDQVREQTYRSLSLSTLLGLLGRCRRNMMVIG